MPRFDYSAAIEELQTFRTTNERRSEYVASLGARLIKDKYINKLNDQGKITGKTGFILRVSTKAKALVVWPLYEQITIAALDISDFELAQHCLDQLQARFGDSSLRLQRLKGMVLEAQGKLDEAQKVYDDILEKDATHLLASKRQIVLLKQRNKTQEAIEAMTQYLDTYYDDHEGWIELCNMYLEQHYYEQAAFCCEELIILQPANHIWYLKYAEIVYTLGNLSLAMKHYCKVLELCTDHVRALYGLQLCASKLKANAEHAGDLHALATERLLSVYSGQPEHVRQLVQDYLGH